MEYACWHLSAAQTLHESKPVVLNLFFWFKLDLASKKFGTSLKIGKFQKLHPGTPVSQ